MNPFRLLVVDDEWIMRNLLRLFLTNHGLEVIEASNGKEALQVFAQEPFDLIILDVMMPESNGWEVCSKIRETSQIPILMLSGRDDSKDKEYGLKLGANDYLGKPFEPEELVTRVFALLRR